MPVLSDDPLEPRANRDAPALPQRLADAGRAVEGPTEDAPIPDLTPEQIAALTALNRVAGNYQAIQQRKDDRGGRRPGAGAPRGNLNALKHGRTSRQMQALIQFVTEDPTSRDALAAIARRRRRQRLDAEKTAGLLLSGLLARCLAAVENNQNAEEVARLRALIATFIGKKIPQNQSMPPFKSTRQSERVLDLIDGIFEQFGIDPLTH